MKSCQSTVSLWYLDDGTLAGDPDTVLGDLSRIQGASDSLGLSVNPEKCELFFTRKHPDTEKLAQQQEIIAQFEVKAPKIKVKTEGNMNLLGAPITEGAMDSILREKLEALELMGDRLKEVDAHDALFLLKNCFAIPKLMYVLRTAPTFKHPEILLEYDNKLKEVLQSILNVTLEDDAWLQSSLPVTSGGLGIRLASDLALPTFLSSAHGAEKGMATLLPDIIKEEQYDLRQEAEITWKETVTNNNGEPTTAVPSTRSIQSSWDKPMFELKHSQLLNSQTNIADKARLLAVSSEHSSDWLNALPVPALGLKLDNPSIRMACGLRLGTPLCHPHPCQC